jgi:hypothetical protein
VVTWAERSLGEQRDRLIHLPLAAGERQMALR